MMQRRSVWEIEKETLALEQQIAAARHHGATISGGAGGTALSSEDAEAMAFDWTKILSQLAGSGDHRELTRLISRLAGMTVGEINSALDEIGQLDLPTESRDLLAKILLPSLVAKDPEVALERFPLRTDSHYTDQTVAGELNKALNIWAQKDLAKATAWMDRKISSGAFDDRSLVGDSAMRIILEQALLHVLLPVDPAAAGRRLAAMTEEGAFSVLSRKSLRATRRIDDDAAFATLARATLSETRKIELFSNEAERLSDNTAEVSEYLDRIDATPIEREACVEAAAGTRFYRISSERPVTLEDLETLRQWAGTDHSDIDRMTGKALGNAIIGCRTTFEEASALVLHYYEASGDDSVIRAFLASEARSFGDSARALAEKIADPEQRAEILERIW